MTSPYDQYNDIHKNGGVIMQGPVAYIVGYAEAREVLGDPKRFIKDYRSLLSDEERIRAALLPNTFDMLYDNMLMRDGDNHARQRALISKAFTGRSVKALAPRIQQITDELIDAFEPKGETDLIADFCYLLPIIVICELLGIPTEDRDKFRVWSHAFLGISNDEDPYGNSIFEFVEYIGRIIHLRRHDPQDDLITRLIQAEEDGAKLTEQELFSMIALLIVAGHETTVNLISGGIAGLLQRPDQADFLRQNPDKIDSAIEEFLRYEGPIEMATQRYVAEETTIGGVKLPRGASVLVVAAAANRDPAVFEDGATLDVNRSDNKHLGFGHGVHYCVGAPLARLEGRIAIETILRRLPTLQLAVAPSNLEYNDSVVTRGLRQLPVRW